MSYIHFMTRINRETSKSEPTKDPRMKEKWSYLNNMFIPLHIKQIMAHSIIGPFMYDRSNLQLHMSVSIEIIKSLPV